MEGVGVRGPMDRWMVDDFFFFKFTMAGFRYSMTRIRKRNFVRRILLENRVNLIRSIRRGLKLERIIEGCREFL